MPTPLKDLLLKYRQDFVWKWIFRPMLYLQLVVYFSICFRVLRKPIYEKYILNGTLEQETFYINHLGNFSSLTDSPDVIPLIIHALMAFFWVLGWLVQVSLVEGMGLALKMDDYSRYKLKRKYHSLLGKILLSFSFLGCCAGPIIAYRKSNHPPMKFFLSFLLPCIFLPSLVQIWRSARQRDPGHVARHKFWATIIFLAMALASLWSAPLIYLCSRASFLGPRSGELVGTFLSSILNIGLIQIPAYLSYRKSLREERMQEQKRMEKEDKGKKLENSKKENFREEESRE